MRPEQRLQKNLLIAFLAAILIASCSGPRTTAEQIQVTIVVDGEETGLSVPSGSTVQFAIDTSGITLGTLDRLDPPGYTLLDAGSTITVTRVGERFEIEQIEIPFERQTLRNESLPIGESHLLQPGSNGMQEITYRILEEGGVEISRTR
ncbi:MAG: G5 domain-containing protein [Anaerolineales bacterium]